MKGNNTFQKSLKLKGKQMTKRNAYKPIHRDEVKPLIDKILDSDLRHAILDWVTADFGDMVHHLPFTQLEESKIYVVKNMHGHENLQYLERLFGILKLTFTGWRWNGGISPEELLNTIFSMSKTSGCPPVFLHLGSREFIWTLSRCVEVLGAGAFVLAESEFDNAGEFKQFSNHFDHLERLESWDKGGFWVDNIGEVIT